MKLPHRRQFLHLAAAAAALPAPPAADTKTPPGWAPRAESGGNPRVPSQVGGLRLGNAWDAPEVSRYSRPAFCEGSYRRLTRLSIEGEALLARQRVPLAFVGQAVTNRIANAPYVLDLGLERPTALAYSNFILL